MAFNKQDSLIPSGPTEDADGPPTEAPRAEPDQHIPLAPAAGAPIDAAPPKQPGAAGKAADLWSNGRWAVTEAGLELINGGGDSLPDREGAAAGCPARDANLDVGEAACREIVAG